MIMSNSTSLTNIKDKYEPNSVHLLLPTVYEEQLSPFHKLSVMEVKADLSSDSGDVFKVGGQYVKTGGKEVWVNYFSPAKPLLMRIALAAGIQFNPQFTGVTSGMKNMYQGKAQGAIKLPDGTYKTHYDEKLINLDDEEDKFRVEFMDKSIEGIPGKAATEASRLFKGVWKEVDDKYGKPGEIKRVYVIDDCDRDRFIERSVLVNMVLLRKHAPQKAITGAILRVIRALTGMKGQYTEDELRKPFVLARVNFSPDFNDPWVRQEMLKSGVASINSIFGNSNAHHVASQPVFGAVEEAAVDVANVENDPFISDSYKDDENEALPWERSDYEEEPDNDPDSLPINPNACQRCEAPISDKVSNYSINKFSHYLCMTCQKGA